MNIKYNQHWVVMNRLSLLLGSHLKLNNLIGCFGINIKNLPLSSALMESKSIITHKKIINVNYIRYEKYSRLERNSVQ